MSKKRKKTGLPPGSIVFTGKRKVEKIIIHYLQYDGTKLVEDTFDNQKNHVFSQPSDDHVDWYDFRGLHDSELVEFFGNAFHIHPIILENVVDVNQRPKYEEYETGNFISIRSLRFDKTKLKVLSEQVSLYFKTGFLVTFQENETDLLESVRIRIQSGKGRIRQRGADYLAYAIADSIVDNYFETLDDIEEVIEELEDRLLEYQDVESKSQIHHLKKEILVLRRSVAPLREAIGRFAKSESDLVSDKNQIFIRDLYDHTIHIIDTVDTYRDILNGLQDLFITEVSFKMNQVMQVLTLVATIFIPLTFLAGIYGMNFEYIPELKIKYGYFYLLGVMAITAAILLYYFKRKKWL